MAPRYRQTIPLLFRALGEILSQDASVENGLGYRTTDTARSGLSSVLTSPGNVTFGNHPLVSRFLKGVFELKPSLPRYHRIWDVSVVLRHLTNLEPVYALDLKVLTLKFTMLLCPLTGQRCQTLSKLDITLMQKLPGRYVYTIGEKLKQLGQGNTSNRLS